MIYPDWDKKVKQQSSQMKDVFTPNHEYQLDGGTRADVRGTSGHMKNIGFHGNSPRSCCDISRSKRLNNIAVHPVHHVANTAKNQLIKHTFNICNDNILYAVAQGQ